MLPREKCRGTTPDQPKGSANRNVYGAAGLFRQHVVTSEGNMDQPKRPEPEIMPPVPNTEPQRIVPEIPPNQDAPEKRSPTKGEN
jgi:hypothetical protein